MRTDSTPEGFTVTQRATAPAGPLLHRKSKYSLAFQAVKCGEAS